MPSNTFPWNTVNTLVGDYVVKNIRDQWSKSNAFYYRAKNRIRKFSGGRSIQHPLAWKAMPSQWISGADIIDTTQRDPVTMGTWWPKTCVTPITVTWEDEQTVNGPNQVKSLVETLGEIAKSSAIETIGTDIFNDGSELKHIEGLQYSLKDFTGSAPGVLPAQTYGNYPRQGRYDGSGGGTQTNNWWIHAGDNTAYSDAPGGNFDPLTQGTVLKVLGRMWAKIFLQSGKYPTLILSNVGSFTCYHNALSANDRYARPTQDSKMAEAGYENLKYKRAVWVQDEKAPRSTDGNATEKIYFINEDTVRLFVHENADFTYMPFRQPHNQLARTAYIVWRGQLVVIEPRANGVISSVGTANSS